LPRAQQKTAKCTKNPTKLRCPKSKKRKANGWGTVARGKHATRKAPTLEFSLPLGSMFLRQWTPDAKRNREITEGKNPQQDLNGNKRPPLQPRKN